MSLKQGPRSYFESGGGGGGGLTSDSKWEGGGGWKHFFSVTLYIFQKLKWGPLPLRGPCQPDFRLKI